MIFAGLVTQFLRQSAKPEPTDDPMLHYLVPSIGCAVANWLGNEGHHLAALAMLAAALAYIARFLHPWRSRSDDH